MKKTFLLFDFDGTLANTLPVIFEAFGTIFREFRGVEVAPADIVPMFGPTEIGTIDAQFPGDPRRDAIVRRFYEIYEREHDRLTPPVDAMRGLLRALAAGGVRTGVFTGKARRSLDLSLAKLFPGFAFDVLVTGDDVRRPKPDPEGVRAALARLDCPADEALFVGDSPADVAAGRAAGVATVQAGWWGVAPSLPPGENVPRFDRLGDFRRFASEATGVVL